MTLLDEVRRFLAEDTRRRVTDPKPLYATAGAVDLAVDFLRGVPQKLESAADRARVEWTPERFGDAFTDLVDEARDSADDAVRRLQEQRSRITSASDLAGSARDVTDQVLGEARRAPGRVAVSVAETAGAVFETYDDLAERGKTVLARLRGDAAPGETATSGRPGDAAPVFRRPTSPTAPPPPAGPPGDPAGVAPAGHDVSAPLPTPAEHSTPADLPPLNAAPPNAAPLNAAPPNAAPPNAAPGIRAGTGIPTGTGTTSPARKTPARRAATKRTASRPTATQTPEPTGAPVRGNAVTARKVTDRAATPRESAGAEDGSSGVQDGSPGAPPANAARRRPRTTTAEPDGDAGPTD